jgi:hypothetical protein
VRNDLFTCGWYYGRLWDDIHHAYCGSPNSDDCICPHVALDK